MTFEECVLYCAGRPDVLREFDRLRGTNLSMRGAPIDLMIDEQSGRLGEDARKFIDFVYDAVWSEYPKTESVSVLA